MEITNKSKFKQLLCRHKNTGWYTKKTSFYNLSGERQYKICRDCGKVLDEIFLEYEGMGFK